MVLGCGLSAGVLATLVSAFLPEEFQSFSEIRQSQAAISLLESLDLGSEAPAMRALMAGRDVCEAVASEPGLLKALGFDDSETDRARFMSFYAEHVSVAPTADPKSLFVIGRHQDPMMAAKLANLAVAAGQAVLRRQIGERQALRRAARAERLVALRARVADVEQQWSAAARAEHRRRMSLIDAEIERTGESQTARERAIEDRRRLVLWWDERPAGPVAARLEAELHVLMSEMESLRLVDAPLGAEPPVWFVQSKASPGQHRIASWGWMPVAACSIFAAAFAALVWLARDASRAY